MEYNTQNQTNYANQVDKYSQLFNSIYSKSTHEQFHQSNYQLEFPLELYRGFDPLAHK